MLSIKYLAETISKNAVKLGSTSKVKFIKNPRVEKEKHNMKMKNKNFLKILKSNPINFKDESKLIIKLLIKNKIKIIKYKKSLI